MGPNVFFSLYNTDPSEIRSICFNRIIIFFFIYNKQYDFFPPFQITLVVLSKNFSSMNPIVRKSYFMDHKNYTVSWMVFNYGFIINYRYYNFIYWFSKERHWLLLYSYRTKIEKINYNMTYKIGDVILFFLLVFLCS